MPTILMIAATLGRAGFAVQAFASAKDFLDSPYAARTSCLILESVREVSFGIAQLSQHQPD
jgi:FixJ family two-component response regulator